MAKKTQEELFNELVAAKIKAGLSRADAEIVARGQFEEDEAAKEAAAIAAEKAAANKKPEGDKKPEGEK